MVELEPAACVGGGGPPLMRSRERTEHGTTGVCPLCSRRLDLDENGLLPEHALPEHDVEQHGSY